MARWPEKKSGSSRERVAEHEGSYVFYVALDKANGEDITGGRAEYVLVDHVS